jgi:hypothetical protein
VWDGLCLVMASPALPVCRCQLTIEPRFGPQVGLSWDKDLAVCLATILRHAPPSRVHLVQAAHPRAASPEDLAYAAQVTGVGAGGGDHQGLTDRGGGIPAVRIH